MPASEMVLGDNIRSGVEALREKHDRAEVIAEDDDEPYVFIDLGQVDLNEYGYDQDEARIVLRIHKDFPREQNYGMVTIPVLTVDGSTPDNTTKNGDKARSLRDIDIEEDYLFWSRDWREVTVSRPQDMVKAIAFVRGTLGNPLQNE